MNEVVVLKYDNYRSYLRDVLEGKTARNASFSLRAFARLLDICPSHLSRALKGTKKLSVNAARQISTALNHTAEEADHFLALVELESAKNTKSRIRVLRRLAKASGKDSTLVNLEIFQAVADWYHFALLALTQTRGFVPDAIWMSRRLGLTPTKVRSALERLQSLGLLEKRGRQFVATNDADLTTTDDLTSAAIQENHKQHLALAEQAVDKLSVELREFNNLTFVMDLKDVPKAKKMIRSFMNQFTEELESKPGDEVFQLNVQLHMLSSSREKG